MPGVYEIQHFTGTLRVIVVHELRYEEHNALLHLFSAGVDGRLYGAAHYRPRSDETSTVLLQLFHRYQLEPTLMPDALQEFARETIEQLLRELPAEQLLKGVPPKKRLEGLSADQRLEGLSLDDLLAALSPENRAALARRVRGDGSLAEEGENESEPRP